MSDIVSLNRRKFIAALGKLVAPMESTQAIQALEAMLPGLADIPEVVFDQPGRLAIAVAKKCHRTPTLKVLWEALDQQRPQPPAVTSAQADPNEEWTRKVDRERKEATEDWSDPVKIRLALRALDGHPMRVFLGGMLGAMVQRHAPQNLHHIPPEFHGAAS